MDSALTQYIEFLFRWIHFLSGIVWIGMLYYFNLVQTPFFGTELGGGVKGVMTRGLVPNAMWWFRWGAMFTFLSGWLIVLMKLGHGVLLSDPYMTRILTGGLLGTLMWFNVWFIIWPAQRDFVIKSAEQVAAGGKPVDGTPDKAALAGRASRTNTLFSIPMLLFMGSASHAPGSFLAGERDLVYWSVFAVIVLALELNAVVGPAAPARQKYLTTVSGVIHYGVLVALALYAVGIAINS
ncbi:MAG TPA: urate hydroxylase PuuD [Myxococcota bacterium]|nr:urate hydroxylase PuuD [Myxococcota bacterium]